MDGDWKLMEVTIVLSTRSYESTGMFPVCFIMHIFLVMYNFDRKFILINEPIWQGHMGNIGNNELCKYKMWINYLKIQISTELNMK